MEKLNKLTLDLIKSVAAWIEGLAKMEGVIDATSIRAKLSHLSDAIQARDGDTADILAMLDSFKGKKKITSVDAMDMVERLHALK